MSHFVSYFVARSCAHQMEREGRSTRIFLILGGIPLAIAVLGVTYLAAEFAFVLGRMLLRHLFGG